MPWASYVVYYCVDCPWLKSHSENFTAISYRDSIEMGIVGGRMRVPHLQNLLRYMHDALDELEAISA